MTSRFQLPLADVGNGITPSAGAKLNFFIPGSSSVTKETHSDAAATTANANPVIANGDGLFPAIYITGNYRVTLTDRNNVQIWQEDPVEEYLTGNGVSAFTDYVFNNVADMISGTLPNATIIVLNVGDTVTTQGYNSAGDGGGNEYIVVASATGTDDGGSFIDLLTHQAKGLFQGGEIHLEQFGGDGDGVVLNTTAIDNIITFAGNNDIHIGQGTFLTNGNHAITTSPIFKGSGIGGTEIKLAGTNTSDDMFQLGAGSENTGWKDLKLTGNWDTSTTPTLFGHGVVQTAVSSVISFENMVIQKFTGAGIKLIGGIKHILDNINLQTCGLDGMWLDGSSNPITNVTMTGGSSQVMRRSCFRHEGEVAGVRYYGVTMFLAPICIRFAGTSSAVHTQIIGGYIEDISLADVPRPTFRISANAPLDAEDGGTTAQGTGDSIGLLGVDIKGDASGRTVIANTSIYQWTLSIVATGEYYLELLSGGDPGLASPNVIKLDNVAKPKNKLGSLNLDEWGYGDNDTLGFNTVYVRLADGMDPDVKPTGFVAHMLTWDIPDGSSTIAKIQMIGTGTFASRPQSPTTATDPEVFFDDDQGKIVQSRALSAFPNGVENRVALNSATGGNAGKSRVIVEAFNAQNVREEAHLEYSGNARTWTVGSPDDVGTAILGNSTGQIQFVGVNTPVSVGAAGGASALPATPLGYFEIKNSAGTTVKVPFYNT